MGFKIQFPKQSTSIAVLTFVYYFVFATCFDPAGSSSGSFHDTFLLIGFYPNMDKIFVIVLIQILLTVTRRAAEIVNNIYINTNF
jgi:hypothetical protein